MSLTTDMRSRSRYLPRRGFSVAQPGVAGTPATPGYRPTRRAGGRAHRCIGTHGLAETAANGALNRGGFTARHGRVVPPNAVTLFVSAIIETGVEDNRQYAETETEYTPNRLPPWLVSALLTRTSP